MTATSVYTKGTQVPGPSKNVSKRLSRVSRWEMIFDIADDNTLEQHLLYIENSLSSDVVLALNSISLAASVVFEFEIYKESGISIPDSFVRLVADCGASIDVDVLASS
jgi:hypothetical protein